MHKVREHKRQANFDFGLCTFFCSGDIPLDLLKNTNLVDLPKKAG